MDLYLYIPESLRVSGMYKVLFYTFPLQALTFTNQTGLYVRICLAIYFQGSPSNRPDLRALNVEHSRMCVILSAKKHIIVDQSLLDKEAILAALNLKGMFSNRVEEKIKAIGSMYFTMYTNIKQHV